ncbi:ISL3 family transposase [Streptomyces sp. NPDC001970]
MHERWGRGLHERPDPLAGDPDARPRRWIRGRPRIPSSLPGHRAGRSAAVSRTVAGWILTHPDALPENEGLKLKSVLAHCPELNALARHVRCFGQMLTELQGERLPEWIAAVRADDLPSLNTFTNGLERELAAVTAGLTLPWSSGVVEGRVNRIKMIKRQMYGRAGFELLRKRVLLAS